MKPGEFISQLDEALIVSAIGEAEKKTSGEIRVYISHKERHDALAFATKRFQQLGMTKTRQRNAVLIYIVPKTNQFAVVGDEGIHQRCGNEFWNEIAAGMSERMKAGQFTDAIVNAIHQITDVLAKYFPGGGENPNELTNEIARD
ncbi:MAG TPA: TPM domain-containing protein [Candidatus Acidoferrum sp.]|nr:TPM domain-containing protein [Candidatus Acidoferrum sp.]